MGCRTPSSDSTVLYRCQLRVDCKVPSGEKGLKKWAITRRALGIHHHHHQGWVRRSSSLAESCVSAYLLINLDSPLWSYEILQNWHLKLLINLFKYVEQLVYSACHKTLEAKPVIQLLRASPVWPPAWNSSVEKVWCSLFAVPLRVPSSGLCLGELPGWRGWHDYVPSGSGFVFAIHLTTIHILRVFFLTLTPTWIQIICAKNISCIQDSILKNKFCMMQDGKFAPFYTLAFDQGNPFHLPNYKTE